MIYKSTLLGLAALLAMSSAANATEVIYTFKGVITSREARGTNNTPAAFQATDPQIGDDFEMTARFSISPALSTDYYANGTYQRYESRGSTSLKVGNWSLDTQQQGFFKQKIEVANDVAFRRPIDTQLYYPADYFTFLQRAGYMETDSSSCPVGLFSGISDICMQVSFSASGYDTSGKVLTSSTLSSLDIGLFQPEEMSFQLVTGLFDFRKLTIGNISMTTETVTAVPEPTTWAMMLVGFAMVGATARYRRRSITATYA